MSVRKENRRQDHRPLNWSHKISQSWINEHQGPEKESAVLAMSDRRSARLKPVVLVYVGERTVVG